MYRCSCISGQMPSIYIYVYIYTIFTYART